MQSCLVCSSSRYCRWRCLFLLYWLLPGGFPRFPFLSEFRMVILYNVFVTQLYLSGNSQLPTSLSNFLWSLWPFVSHGMWLIIFISFTSRCVTLFMLQPIEHFWVLQICFSCAPPYSKCGDMTMFLNVLYAGIMVVSAVLLVPVLKENMQMLARIKGWVRCGALVVDWSHFSFYSKELMPEDTSRLKMQDVETQMILKIFTISNLNTKHSASSCSKD